MITIHEIEEQLDIELDCENCETLNGLIIVQLLYIPDQVPLNSIIFQNITFSIQKIKDRWVEEVKFK